MLDLYWRIGRAILDRQEAEGWGARVIDRLPWGHVIVLLDEVPDPVIRDWYAGRTVVNGWTRKVLLNAIKSRTHERVAAASSNFQVALDPAEATQTQLLIKDPYVFDFLALTGVVAERDLEAALIDNLQHTLLELGTGFAFVDRQVHFYVRPVDEWLRSADHASTVGLLLCAEWNRAVVSYALVGDSATGSVG